MAWHLSQPIIDKWKKRGLKSKFIIPLPEVKNSMNEKKFYLQSDIKEIFNNLKHLKKNLSGKNS